MKTYRITVLIFLVIFSDSLYSQNWVGTGNAVSTTNFLGSTNNESLRFRTNNTLRGLFTTGNALGSGSTLGDGLRIVDPLVGGPGNLDMWTSGSTQTHIKWDGSGLIQGVSSRFEMIGNYNGLWFNTTGGTGRYIFNRTSGETGRIGVNNFWRIGLNALDIDANRRLETFDNTNPQLRLTSVSNATLSLGVWTDFQTTSLGHLFLNPRNNGAGGNVGVNIATPTSRLHVNSDDRDVTAIQITNNSTTGNLVADGLFLGLPATANNNMPGIFSNRENDRIEFRTNDQNGVGERMRIMHTGALNAGVDFNPGGLANNLTRVGISHNPANPLTRPLSLLHLGYNTQASQPNENGWRPWMDVGMFVSQESDHLYLGLKDEGNDRKDAILNWGDNQINAGPAGAGPDNFRMIFTSTPFALAGGTAPAIGANGLEGLRMTPTILGINTGIGGDPTSNQYGPLNNSQNPTATLEVNAWGGGNNTSGLRFTNLNSTNTNPTPNPGNGVLSVNLQGDVIYVEANNAQAIGNYCPDAQQPLQDHFEVPLNGLSYSFTAQSGSNDMSTVNIGNVACGLQMPVRLYVQQSEPMPNQTFHAAIGGVVDATNLPFSTEQYGIMGMIENSNSNEHAGVYGLSMNGQYETATGVLGVSQGNPRNFGVKGICNDNHASENTGVYGEARYGSSNFAGRFEGDVIINGGGWINGLPILTSDRQFKSNIKPIPDAMRIISQLKPSTYYMDTLNAYGLNFASTKQYGLIAQEVEQVLPELVHSTMRRETYDSTRKVLTNAVTYKGVEYNAFIGIIIAAMQEQQAQIEAKDSLLNALNDKFTNLENCINRLNLCNNGANYRTIGNTANTESETQENTTAQSVKLSDPQSIVLNQNVPNPFAEKTGISYYLPKSVKSAKIIFHNQEGKLINSIDIAERGNGSLNVYADDLSSGIYTYTLIADDNVIDTKRMVKN